MSIEAAESVLQGLGFDRSCRSDMWRRRPAAKFEKELAAFVNEAGEIVLRMGQRTQFCDERQFRRIVDAEIRAAAAWRGEA